LDKVEEELPKMLEKREEATRSGAGRTQLPTCQYFKELLFITDTVANRPTCSNVSPSTKPQNVCTLISVKLYPDVSYLATESNFTERSVPSPAAIVVPSPKLVNEAPPSKKRKRISRRM